MIRVEEALEKVLSEAGRRGSLSTESVSLAEACGRVLRDAVAADRDFPPFTRSAMDGYAVRAADLASVPADLDVIEEIPAGVQPRLALGPGQASRIMTGAPLPEGADAVQMVEQTERLAGGRVRINQGVSPGEHVRRAGEEIRHGEPLLEPGIAIGAVAVALLASAGHPSVRVSRRPRVAILPTGDELVGIDARPGPSQIRESNGATLEALVRIAGGTPVRHPVARDTMEDLRARIGQALQGCDILLLSGGVSMGDYDLVGRALLERGCRPVFDRVAIQPGKPLFFGVMPEEPSPLVFGLPGNPVSTVVDFLLFARPAMRRLAGESEWLDPVLPARLETAHRRRPGRRAYLPAALSLNDGALVAALLPSRGSSDMVAMSRADALAILPEEVAEFPAGAPIRVLPLRGLTR